MTNFAIDPNRPSIRFHEEPRTDLWTNGLQESRRTAGILQCKEKNGQWSFGELSVWADYVAQIRGNAAIFPDEHEFMLVVGDFGVLHAVDTDAGPAIRWLAEEDRDCGHLPEWWMEFEDAYNNLQASKDTTYRHRAGVYHAFAAETGRLGEKGIGYVFGQ